MPTGSVKIAKVPSRSAAWSDWLCRRTYPPGSIGAGFLPLCRVHFERSRPNIGYCAMMSG